MLETIKDFIVGIGEMLMFIWDFVIGFFEDIAYIVKLTGQAVLHIPDIFSWLPVEMVALIVLIIGVVVVYKVTGREG